MTSAPALEELQPSNGSPSTAPDPVPVYVGFGKFQLLARLGKGGMGEVFLASVKGMQGFNKLVVVKRLRETLAEDAEMRELLLAEGRLAARLNHPNVVQTNEVGEEQGALYLSMEYLEGQPLSEINRKLGPKQLDTTLAARIVSEALAGLHYAHDLADYDGTPLHLVHRDVSPQNIFITYDGATKVVDFGVAKVAWQVSGKTQNGVLKGKVAYMAPEQVAGSPDRRSDIFSMGIVLWELVARKRLFPDPSVAKILHRIVNETLPRVSTVTSGVHPALDDIIARALERDPTRRFQTAQQMRDALEAFVAETGHFVRQEDVAQFVRAMFKNRRERVRRQVQASLKAASEATSLMQLPPLNNKREAGMSSVSRAASLTGSLGLPPPATRTVRSELGTGPPADKSSRVLRQAAVVLVVGLLGAISLLAGMKSRHAEANRAHAADPPAPDTAAVAPARAAPAAPPAAVATDEPDVFEVVPVTSAQKKTARTPHWAAHAIASAPGPSPPPSSAIAPAAAPAAEPAAAVAQQPKKRKFRTEF